MQTYIFGKKKKKHLKMRLYRICNKDWSMAAVKSSLYFTNILRFFGFPNSNLW